ncbi:MAG: hypothetical protein U0T81_15225 [Saprospiraceae bacterium]
MIYRGAAELLIRFARLGSAQEVDADDGEAQSFLGLRHKYFVRMPVSVNLEVEIAKIKEEIEYARGFLASCEKKLGNERFVASAPPDLVEKERKKWLMARPG